MAPDAARLERARRFAGTAAAIGCGLVLAVIVASAYLRLAQIAPGWTGAGGLARAVHRLAASAEAALVIAVVAVCWGARRQWAGGALTAAAIGALTVLLVLVGIATPERQPPPVTLANLLGGMALLGTLWSLRIQALGAPSRSPASLWLWTGVALLAVQIALGGLVSAFDAARSCATWPACAGEWWPAGSGRLHMAHRYGAAGLMLYWAALALVLRRPARAAAAGAAAVAAMLLAQGALGIIVVASGAAVAAAVAHNAWAALTVLAAVGAAGRATWAKSVDTDQGRPPRAG
jgi:cytochrome c oxidase assembly protein subunit 15